MPAPMGNNGTAPGGAATPSCLVCGDARTVALRRTRHQRLLRCSACSFVFGWPVFSRESLLDYAVTTFRGEGIPETADFFDRQRIRGNGRGMWRQYRRGLEQIARFVPSGTLLDVGCGVPVFLELARSAGYQVRGVDAVPDAATIARREFDIDVCTGAFDRCELSDGAPFDVVTMWDFLEHVPDPLAALARARELLRPDGVLFVSAPNYRSVLHFVAGLPARLPRWASWASSSCPSAIDDGIDKLYHFSHVCVWSPRAMDEALTRTGFSPLARGVSSPDLNRYRLSPPVRAGLTAIDWLSRVTGLRSRLWVLASPSR